VRSFGHAAGDQALRNSVQLAQQQLRLVDFIGRYGGEEFLLVLTQTELEGASECAERIREKIEGSPFPIANQHRNMTVSIGVAQYRRGESVQAMLERVDAALYRAKAKGRNRIEREYPTS
jgi:diguanylate cyclase (GGDEF)-like protein